MSWGAVLGMCVVALSAALTADFLAQESHKMGWAEGHGDGWRGAMEQNTNINGGLRAELAAAHEATDGVREQLKDTEQRLATVGKEWNRALEERNRAWGEIKRARDELARTKALHQLELSDVKQAQASADAFAVVMSGELAKDSLKLADDVEKVLFTRGRGITHEWRRKKLLALCADVRKRWSKA